MASSSEEVLHLSVLCKRQQQQQLGTTNCRIELSPADAEAIDVLAGEQVLVVPLTREGDDVLTLDSKGEKAACKRGEGAEAAAWGGPIAAVCTVDVAAAPVASSGSGGGKRGNKRPMKAGEAAFPRSLLRRLFDEEEEFAADDLSAPATPSSSSSSIPNRSKGRWRGCAHFPGEKVIAVFWVQVVLVRKGRWRGCAHFSSFHGQDHEDVWHHVC